MAVVAAPGLAVAPRGLGNRRRGVVADRVSARDRFQVVGLAAGVSNTSVGISPWQANLNVTYFVLGHNVGLLWIDALFRWFSREPRADLQQPHRHAASRGGRHRLPCWRVSGAGRLAFLSGHVWPHLRRAAGTLADANAFGVIAALWAPGFVVIGARFPPAVGDDHRHRRRGAGVDGRVDVRIAHRADLVEYRACSIALESVRAWRRTEGAR